MSTLLTLKWLCVCILILSSGAYAQVDEEKNYPYKIRSLILLRHKQTAAKKLCLVMNVNGKGRGHICSQDAVPWGRDEQAKIINRFASLFDSKVEMILKGVPYKYNEHSYGLFPTALLDYAMEQFPNDSRHNFKKAFTQAQLLEIMDRLENLESDSSCLIAAKNYQAEMKTLRTDWYDLTPRSIRERTLAAEKLVLDNCREEI